MVRVGKETILEIFENSILVGSEGNESLFGLVNGISRTAQSLDADARADMEMLAGHILLSD